MWNWQQWPWSPERPSAPPTAPKPESAVDAVLAERADARAKIKAIRDRADATAKLIGAVATALAGYLGVAKLSDIFPFHRASDLDTAALIGFAAAVAALVGGVIWWISLLGRVSAPVVLKTSRPVAGAAPNDLTDREVGLVDDQYDEHAKLNDAPSLEALDTYVRATIAAAGGAAGRPAPVRGLAARSGGDWTAAGDPQVLDAEIRVVLVRAVHDVVRSRYRDAFASGRARTAMALAAAGYVGLAVSTNYLVGQSAGQVTRAAECAKLVDAQLKTHLLPTEELASCRGLVPGVAGAAARSMQRAAPPTSP